jgi:hypothetical protein
MDYQNEDYYENDYENEVQKLNARLTWFSNYDCMNSHWLESQGDLTGYFNQIVEILGLKKRDIKKEYPQYRFENEKMVKPKKPVVDTAQFLSEFLDGGCGALLFTIAIKIDSDFAGDTITVPKGAKCGFFSSWHGGGSFFNLELIEDFKVSLLPCGSKYNHWGIEYEKDTERGNSIESVFGGVDGMFEKGLIK